MGWRSTRLALAVHHAIIDPKRLSSLLMVLAGIDEERSASKNFIMHYPVGDIAAFDLDGQIASVADEAQTKLIAAGVETSRRKTPSDIYLFVLEGIDRHSATGIMKAHWNDQDYFEMRRKRVRDGLTNAQARGRIETVWPEIRKDTAPVAEPERGLMLSARVTVEPAAHGISYLRTRFTRSLHLLFGVGAMLLLLACINLASVRYPSGICSLRMRTVPSARRPSYDELACSSACHSPDRERLRDPSQPICSSRRCSAAPHPARRFDVADPSNEIRRFKESRCTGSFRAH